MSQVEFVLLMKIKKSEETWVSKKHLSNMPKIT